jgi:pyruvate, orthophosphate dikinase
MMDSVLNIGINDEVWHHMILVTGNPKFAHDLYRRFLQMYGNIVLKVPNETYLDIIEEQKAHDGVSLESHLSITSLENLVLKFKAITDVPSDPFEQLRRTIEAIFCSFYSPRLRVSKVAFIADI